MMWRLEFAYVALPLSLNDRMHWAVKARAARNLRDQVRWLARHQRIPRLEKIHVQMHWTPAVARSRDQDNAVATLKPVIDGLRDYREVRRSGQVLHPAWVGVVPDDTPEHVQWSPPLIHPAQPDLCRRLWIDVTDLSELSTGVWLE